MQLQPGVFPVNTPDYPQTVEVQEATVRATHHFISEAGIQFFKLLVRSGLDVMQELACARDTDGQVAGIETAMKAAHGGLADFVWMRNYSR